MDKSQAYSLLGLGTDATEDDIKAAYLALAKKYAPENYEAGPLQEEAAGKMDELNSAFDTVMSYLRTGAAPAAADVPGADSPPPYAAGQAADADEYAAIRQLINSGQADEALAMLGGIPGGPNDAEWNFLMGSAYYYKGWLGEALRYFQEACRLDPANPEYRAALRNLTNREQGDMPGTPYVQQDPGSAAIDCACNTCTLMCCLDMCCGGMRRC